MARRSLAQKIIIFCQRCWWCRLIVPDNLAKYANVWIWHAHTKRLANSRAASILRRSTANLRGRKKKKKYKKGGATASELHLHANANKTQSPPFVPCPGIWQQLQTAYRSKGNSKLHRRNAGIRNAGMLKMLLGCLANDFEVATHIGQGVLKNSFHCLASGEGKYSFLQRSPMFLQPPSFPF